MTRIRTIFLSTSAPASLVITAKSTITPTTLPGQTTYKILKFKSPAYSGLLNLVHFYVMGCLLPGRCPRIKFLKYRNLAWRQDVLDEHVSSYNFLSSLSMLKMLVFDVVANSNAKPLLVFMFFLFFFYVFV